MDGELLVISKKAPNFSVPYKFRGGSMRLVYLESKGNRKKSMKRKMKTLWEWRWERRGEENEEEEIQCGLLNEIFLGRPHQKNIFCHVWALGLFLA